VQIQARDLRSVFAVAVHEVSQISTAM